MRLFISTGEPSGDLHAANLIHSLRKCLPDAEFVGFGGPRMAAAGADLLYPLVELAVMWFVRVLLNLPTFIRLLFQANRYFRDQRPDAVILIDYPGFNWCVARRAKRHGIPVFYYVPPQIWAWAGWRVEKVRKYVDQVLCGLPFEPAWYHARGVPGAIHVGHPYFDELAERELDEAFLAEQRDRGGTVLAILPGSRTQELLKNLPTMLAAAARLGESRPDVRFVVACLHEKHRALAREILGQSGVRLPIEVHAGRTPELIRLADVAWAVSGSVGLELMAEALPSVVLYKMRAFDLWLARKFIKAKYISLVNLLADAELYPEYLTSEDVSGQLADWARTWLNDPAARAEKAAALAALRDRDASPGASDRAADRIVAALVPAATPQGRHAFKRPHATPAAETAGDRRGDCVP